jgi:hypothetical protein
MSIWAYKVITSGKGGFATPALLETFLNQLGTDGWEIIHFQTQPDNPLAFTGLARRTTQRDWTLEDAAAAAARAEVDKLRAEYEAKFRGAGAPGAEAEPETIAGQAAGEDDGLRRLRDTDRDLDADSDEDEAEPDEWEKLAKEDELPTFFEAIHPLMRRNQRGSGQAVGVDHLARKWGMSEDDVVGALKECGFTVPTDENAKPVYVEYDGDLYWVNVNRRGELWINTKEKTRPVFRTVAATPVAPAEGEAQPEPKGETESAPAAEAASRPAPEPAAPLDPGPALLERIRPHMRRNRRGPGGSGSASFLSRALKCREADLVAAFNAMGFALPEPPESKPVVVTIGAEEWWLARDSRGGTWIYGQEAASAPAGGTPPAEGAPAPTEPAPAPASAAAPASDTVFAAVRLLLKPTRTGALAGEITRLSETLGKGPEQFLEALKALGLKVPEKAREKPVFVQDGDDIFWLNRNAKDELWLNAKPSKFAAGEDEPEKKHRRPKAKDEAEPQG